MSRNSSLRAFRSNRADHYIHQLSSFGRKCVSLLLLVVLILANIPPADAQSLIRKAKALALRFVKPATLQGNSGNHGMPAPPINPPGVTPGPPPTKQEREAKVSKLRINPHDELTLQLGQVTMFSAVPLDQDGNTIHGLKADWESSDPLVLSIDIDGEAIAKKVGSSTITATIASKKEKVKINVGPRKK